MTENWSTFIIPHPRYHDIALLHQLSRIDSLRNYRRIALYSSHVIVDQILLAGSFTHTNVYMESRVSYMNRERQWRHGEHVSITFPSVCRLSFAHEKWSLYWTILFDMHRTFAVDTQWGGWSLIATLWTLHKCPEDVIDWGILHARARYRVLSDIDSLFFAKLMFQIVWDRQLLIHWFSLFQIKIFCGNKRKIAENRIENQIRIKYLHIFLIGDIEELSIMSDTCKFHSIQYNLDYRNY